MKRLNTLDLSNTKVTDRGLEHLRELPKLRTLFLIGTKVTPEGVNRLLEELPELEVIR